MTSLARSYREDVRSTCRTANTIHVSRQIVARGHGKFNAVWGVRFLGLWRYRRRNSMLFGDAGRRDGYLSVLSRRRAVLVCLAIVVGSRPGVLCYICVRSGPLCIRLAFDGPIRTALAAVRKS